MPIEKWEMGKRDEIQTYRPDVIVGIDDEAMEVAGRDVLGLALQRVNGLWHEGPGALSPGGDAAAELTLLTNPPGIGSAVAIKSESVIRSTCNLDNVREARDKNWRWLHLNLVAFFVESEHFIALAVLVREFRVRIKLARSLGNSQISTHGKSTPAINAAVLGES